MNNNLIVDDDYVISEAKRIGDSLSSLEKVLKQYILISKSINSFVIKEGSTSEALTAFIALAKESSGTMNSIKTALNSAARSYIGAIDDADQYLF